MGEVPSLPAGRGFRGGVKVCNSHRNVLFRSTSNHGTSMKLSIWSIVLCAEFIPHHSLLIIHHLTSSLVIWLGSGRLSGQVKR